MSNRTDPSLLDDLANLEQTLASDASGDATRAMLQHYGRLTEQSMALQVGAGDDDDRRLAASLVAAFQAGQRVIAHVWRALHGVELRV